MKTWEDTRNLISFKFERVFVKFLCYLCNKNGRQVVLVCWHRFNKPLLRSTLAEINKLKSRSNFFNFFFVYVAKLNATGKKLVVFTRTPATFDTPKVIEEYISLSMSFKRQICTSTQPMHFRYDLHLNCAINAHLSLRDKQTLDENHFRKSATVNEHSKKIFFKLQNESFVYIQIKKVNFWYCVKSHKLVENP